MNRGFTLVELSIVLVIIGLIAGGVVGGKSLIKSSKQQGLVREFIALETAINSFDLQYDAIPGDFVDATDYWPTSNTDSGDGNGKVDNSSGSGGADEPRRGWFHLLLAKKLITQKSIIGLQYTHMSGLVPKINRQGSSGDGGVRMQLQHTRNRVI